jgi:hypothetical protein
VFSSHLCRGYHRLTSSWKERGSVSFLLAMLPPMPRSLGRVVALTPPHLLRLHSQLPRQLQRRNNKIIDSSRTRKYSTSTSSLPCNRESLNRPQLHPRSPSLTMQIPLQQTWHEKAKAKRAKTKSKIPEEWTLNKDDLAAAKKQRQLSGPFIESFLD